MVSNASMEVLAGLIIGVLFLTMIIYEPTIINFAIMSLVTGFYIKVVFC